MTAGGGGGERRGPGGIRDSLKPSRLTFVSYLLAS